MFSSIISRARIVEVLSMGVAGTYDGAIQLVRLFSECVRLILTCNYMVYGYCNDTNIDVCRVPNTNTSCTNTRELLSSLFQACRPLLGSGRCFH